MELRTAKAGLIAGVAIVVAFLAIGCGADPTATPTAAALPTLPPVPTATPTALPPGVTAPTPTATSAVPSTPTPDPFIAEWEALKAAAREEGQLNVAFTHFIGEPTTRQAIAERFKSEFGVRLAIAAGTSGREMAERLRAEYQAGVHGLDIFQVGSGSAGTLVEAGIMSQLADLLFHPESMDSSAYWQGKLPWINPDVWGVGRSMALMTYGGGGEMIINPELVGPEELQSFYDIFDPKWEGRLVIRDLSTGSASTLLFMWTVPELGPDFLAQLVRSSRIASDSRSQAELVMTGEYAIGPFGSGREVRAAKLQGLPLEALEYGMKEGKRASLGSHVLNVLKDPPHPNAQKLFANWFLTRDTQYFIQGLTGIDSLRVDIPKDNVLPLELRQDGDVMPEIEPGSNMRTNEALEFYLSLVKNL